MEYPSHLFKKLNQLHILSTVEPEVKRNKEKRKEKKAKKEKKKKRQKKDGD